MPSSGCKKFSQHACTSQLCVFHVIRALKSPLFCSRSEHIAFSYPPNIMFFSYKSSIDFISLSPHAQERYPKMHAQCPTSRITNFVCVTTFTCYRVCNQYLKLSYKKMYTYFASFLSVHPKVIRIIPFGKSERVVFRITNSYFEVKKREF